uniref:Uncharacterized protein n=1 Tax=Rhizophora mucronata TaxID=61149 RepID=A0A2P2QGK1_RHIMU
MSKKPGEGGTSRKYNP